MFFPQYVQTVHMLVPRSARLSVPTISTTTRSPQLQPLATPRNPWGGCGRNPLAPPSQPGGLRAAPLAVGSMAKHVLLRRGRVAPPVHLFTLGFIDLSVSAASRAFASYYAMLPILAA